jgi:ADP-heptose:LPS heptosyltransferase
VVIKKIIRKIAANPLDKMLKIAKKKNKKAILLAWNRGLGDIPLGMYSIVLKIKEYIPDAKITFLVRKSLIDGFSLLKDIEIIEAPLWKRGEKEDIYKALLKQNINPKSFDLIIDSPDPTYWVKWQLGKIIPKLSWNKKYENLFKTYNLSSKFKYIGIQPSSETIYGYQKNLPIQTWKKLFSCLEKDQNLKILLFGNEKKEEFLNQNIIDLRGKTDLFSLISIIKNKCDYLVLPDSGILSIIYYLNEDFPIKIVSLWSEANQGVLKQDVTSPNQFLKHFSIISKNKNIANITIEEIISKLGIEELL